MAKYTKHICTGFVTEYRVTVGSRSVGFHEAPGNTDYEQMLLDIADDPTCITEQDDTPIPTVDELRIEAYGSFGQQADMQYWDAVNSTTTWVDHIAAVKLANPKA